MHPTPRSGNSINMHDSHLAKKKKTVNLLNFGKGDGHYGTGCAMFFCTRPYEC